MANASKARLERVDLRTTPAATLADRRVFQLDDKQWSAFEAALAAPPKNNPGLRKLLARKPFWAR